MMTRQERQDDQYNHIESIFINFHPYRIYPAPHIVNSLNLQCIPLQGVLCMTMYTDVHRRGALRALCVCMDVICTIHNSCIYAYMNDPAALNYYTWQGYVTPYLSHSH